MKRRTFIGGLAGTVGTTLISGVARGQAKPCPPDPVKVTGGSTAVSSCGTKVAETPAWLKGRAVNEWFQVPGTSLASCPPTTKPFFGRASAKMDAWCGATVRRKGSIYLIGGAGGHGDYNGNEVNALNLRADAPKWVELSPGSPLDVAINSAGVYLDYRAAARHTYWATQFVNLEDRLVLLPKSAPMASDALNAITAANSAHVAAFPGGSVMPSFAAVNWTGFDPGNDWDWKTIKATGNPHYARLTNGYLGATGSLGCANPVTDELYLAASGRLHRWRPDGGPGSWETLAPMSDDYAGSAIDFKRGRMLVVGDYGATVPPRVRSIATGEPISVKFGGLGPAALVMGAYQSVVYDELNDRFLVFKNGEPITVYAVDPESWAVSVLPTSGQAPGPRPQGLNNSVQYVPELNGVVLGHTYAQDVYFMRLA